MSLWLYLRFPRLPLECQPLQQDHPAVVIERQRVIAVNDEAQSAGLKTRAKYRHRSRPRRNISSTAP